MKLIIGMSVSEERLALLVTKWGDKLLALRGSHDCPPTATAAELVAALAEYSFKDECVEWIIKTLVSGGSFWEDLPALRINSTTLYLAKFFELRSQLQPDQRNLPHYTSFSQLVAVINAKLGIGDSTGAVTGLFDIYSAAPYAATLFDSATFRVVQILNRDGALWWSWLWRETGPNKRPSWCTGWENESMYKNYTDAGPLFVVLDKLGAIGGRPDKWQLHLQSDQFKDREDQEVRRGDFENSAGFLQAMYKAPFSADDLAKHHASVGTPVRTKHTGHNLLEYFSTDLSPDSRNRTKFFNLSGYNVAQQLFDACEAGTTTTIITKTILADWKMVKYEDMWQLTPTAYAIFYLFYTKNRFLSIFSNTECNLAEQLDGITGIGHKSLEKQFAETAESMGQAAFFVNLGFSPQVALAYLIPKRSHALAPSAQFESFFNSQHNNETELLDFAWCDMMRDPSTAADYWQSGVLFQLVLRLATNRAKFDALLNKLNQTNTAKLGFAPKDLLALTWHHFFATPLTWNPTLFYLATFGRSEPPGFWSKASKLSGADFTNLLVVMKKTTDSKLFGVLCADLHAIKPINTDAVLSSATTGVWKPVAEAVRILGATSGLGWNVGKFLNGVASNHNLTKASVLLADLAKVPKLAGTIVDKYALPTASKVKIYLRNTEADTDARTVRMRERMQQAVEVFDSSETVASIPAATVVAKYVAALKRKTTYRDPLHGLVSNGVNENLCAKTEELVLPTLDGVDCAQLLRYVLARIFTNYTNWDMKFGVSASSSAIVPRWVFNLLRIASHYWRGTNLELLADITTRVPHAVPHNLAYRVLLQNVASGSYGSGYRTNLFELAPLAYKLLLENTTVAFDPTTDKFSVATPVTASYLTIHVSERLENLSAARFYILLASDPPRLAASVLKYGIPAWSDIESSKVVYTLWKMLYASLSSKYPHAKVVRILLAGYLWGTLHGSIIGSSIHADLRMFVRTGKLPTRSAQSWATETESTLIKVFRYADSMWNESKRNIPDYAKDELKTAISHVLTVLSLIASRAPRVPPIFRQKATNLAKLKSEYVA